jgi:hypothetical protein
MSAVPYDDDVTNPPPKPLRRPPIGVGGDPLVDAAVRLLSVPLREMYAVLWRVGVIEVLA